MSSAFLLPQFPYLKKHKFLVVELGRGLDRVTAYLTIFHIGLLPHGTIQQKGYFLPTVRALEKMLIHTLKFYIEQLTTNLKHLEFGQFCIVFCLTFGQFGIQQIQLSLTKFYGGYLSQFIPLIGTFKIVLIGL